MSHSSKNCKECIRIRKFPVFGGQWNSVCSKELSQTLGSFPKSKETIKFIRMKNVS